MAGATRVDERRFVVRTNYIDLRACLQQAGDDLGMTLDRRCNQGVTVAAPALLDSGAHLQQRIDHVQVTQAGRGNQRRPIAVRAFIDVGAACQQGAHDLDVVILSRLRQAHTVLGRELSDNWSSGLGC
ncbi:hypothetical protein D3C72_1838150 [compost metagenome]